MFFRGPSTDLRVLKILLVLGALTWSYMIFCGILGI